MTEQKFYSGKDGWVRENGQSVARVREWRFSSSVAALPITSLADFAEDYTAGISSAAGSMVIWYYADAPSSIIKRVVRTTQVDDTARVALELGWGPNRILGTAMFTEVRLGPSVGEVMSADCQFVFCGPLRELTL